MLKGLWQSIFGLRQAVAAHESAAREVACLAEAGGNGSRDRNVPPTTARGQGTAPTGIQRGCSVALPQVAELDAKGRQWVHVLPIGVFDREWGDPWVISEQVCQEMAGHFAQKLPQAILPWNCNHKRGTEAPGWIEGVEARADGLHILTRWTEYGKGLLAEEKFKFVSGEWYWVWKRPSDGTEFRNVLRGCALTNDPFFTELPAIAEAEDGDGNDGNGDGEGLATEHTESTENGGGQGNGPADGGTQMSEQARTEQGTAVTGGTPVVRAGQDLGARGGASGAAGGGQPAADGTRAPAGLTPRPPLPREEAAREEGERGTATAGQAGLPAPQAAAGVVTAEQHAALQAEVAVLRARDERRDIVEGLRNLRHPLDTRRRMSPALCEMTADIACVMSNDPATAINMASAGEAPVLRTLRERFFDLVVAMQMEWPMAGATPGGGIRAPEDVSGLNEAEKRVKLNEMAQAKSATLAKAEGESENDWYQRRVEAVLAEKPELRARVGE